MIRSILAALLLPALIAGASLRAWADDVGAPATPAVSAMLGATERRTIVDYFERHYAMWAAATSNGSGEHTGLPPGLARAGVLPPELAAQLERNNLLPPGVTRIYLPDDLMAKLPPLAEGEELILVDDRVLLIEVSTGLILDLVAVAAADGE